MAGGEDVRLHMIPNPVTVMGVRIARWSQLPTWWESCPYNWPYRASEPTFRSTQRRRLPTGVALPFSLKNKVAGISGLRPFSFADFPKQL